MSQYYSKAVISGPSDSSVSRGRECTYPAHSSVAVEHDLQYKRVIVRNSLSAPPYCTSQ